MSIVNAYRCDEYAWISSDSIGFAPDLSRFDVCKLLPLAQAPAVVACRGLMGFCNLVFLGALFRPADFDALLPEMPAMLAACSAQLAEWQQIGFVRPSAPINGLEVVLVGFSKREQRIVGREYRQDGDKHYFHTYEITAHHISPWHQSIEHLCEPRVPKDFERLARAQVELMLTVCPEEKYGGKLIIARLDRHGITIKEQCDLDVPSPAEDAPATDAPRVEIPS